MNHLPRKSFPTTRWSIVLGANAASEEEARDSMEKLCRMYWYPLYSYARHKGLSHHESEDQTQAFLAHIIFSHRVGKADPGKGRFRSFLLTSFRNFLIDDWRRANSQRHGGGYCMEPIDFTQGAARFRRDPVDPAATPEEAFDQAWARELIRHAKEELRAEYKTNGRDHVFDTIEPILLEDPGSVTLTPHADRLGISPHALSEALRRARLRLGNHVAVYLLDTVPNRTEAEQELRHLIQACQGLSGLV